MVCAIMPWSHGKVNENPPVVADVLITCEGYALYEYWTRTQRGLPFSRMSTYPTAATCRLCGRRWVSDGSQAASTRWRWQPPVSMGVWSGDIGHSFVQGHG